jgi:hypothetical protein
MCIVSSLREVPRVFLLMSKATCILSARPGMGYLELGTRNNTATNQVRMYVLP